MDKAYLNPNDVRVASLEAADGRWFVEIEVPTAGKLKLDPGSALRTGLLLYGAGRTAAAGGEGLMVFATLRGRQIGLPAELRDTFIEAYRDVGGGPAVRWFINKIVDISMEPAAAASIAARIAAAFMACGLKVEQTSAQPTKGDLHVAAAMFEHLESQLSQGLPDEPENAH